MRLEDNSTHFQCAGCRSINLVKDGHITKVAYSAYDADTQREFGYYSYYVMLCSDCYECKERERLGEKKDDDGDNNPKQKGSPRRRR